MYYLNVVLNILIGFFIIIMYMSFLGKTQLSQLTAVDFVGNFILGGIVGGVIYNGDVPLLQYISLLLIGVSIISLFNLLIRKIDLFRKVAVGNSIPIVKDGQFIIDNINNKKYKIDIGILSSMLHIQGIKSFQEVGYAQIEPNGQLSVIKKEDNVNFSLPLVCNGSIQCANLERLGKDENWLHRELQKKQIDDISCVFFAEYWQGEVHCSVLNK